MRPSPPWLNCLRPQPTENLLVCEKACAQAETRAPVHNCAQGDLHPQVHPARASGHALVGQVVPCPHPAPPGESYDEFEADEQSLKLIRVSGNPEYTPLCAERLEMPILPRCDIQQGVTEGFTIGAWGHQSPPEHPPTSPGVTRGPPEPTSPGVTRVYRDPPHQGSPKPIGAHQSSRAHTVGAGPASALNCNGTCQPTSSAHQQRRSCEHGS